LSKIKTTFAVQPPCAIARFRTNGSHTLVPGDGCAGNGSPDCRLHAAQPHLNFTVRPTELALSVDYLTKHNSLLARSHVVYNLGAVNVAAIAAHVH
jgi:hypothetical protein